MTVLFLRNKVLGNDLGSSILYSTQKFWNTSKILSLFLVKGGDFSVHVFVTFVLSCLEYSERRRTKSNSSKSSVVCRVVRLIVRIVKTRFATLPQYSTGRNEVNRTPNRYLKRVPTFQSFTTSVLIWESYRLRGAS